MLRSQMARFMQHGSGLVGVLRMAKALGDTMVPPVDTPPRTPRARPSAQAPVADAPKPARKPRARKAAP